MITYLLRYTGCPGFCGASLYEVESKRISDLSFRRDVTSAKDIAERVVNRPLASLLDTSKVANLNWDEILVEEMTAHGGRVYRFAENRYLVVPKDALPKLSTSIPVVEDLDLIGNRFMSYDIVGRTRYIRDFSRNIDKGPDKIKLPIGPGVSILACSDWTRDDDASNNYYAGQLVGRIVAENPDCVGTGAKMEDGTYVKLIARVYNYNERGDAAILMFTKTQPRVVRLI